MTPNECFIEIETQMGTAHECLSPRKKIYGGRNSMIFLQPGIKSMTNGNKIYVF